VKESVQRGSVIAALRRCTMDTPEKSLHDDLVQSTDFGASLTEPLAKSLEKLNMISN